MNDGPPKDPIRAAQEAMLRPRIKRFYAQAGVGEAEGGGFALLLDGKRARTPAKSPLVLPTRALAQVLAREWAGQGETIEIAAMPITRLVTAALDGIALAPGATRAEIVGYAGSDHLCYRAPEPEALVAAEAAAADPILAWAAQSLNAPFVVVVGLVHRAQPDSALAAVRAELDAVTQPIALAALLTMTTLSGSALLALAVASGRLNAAEAWRAAHVAEDFQTAQWGEDEEAAARRAARWADFAAAAEALAALG